MDTPAIVSAPFPIATVEGLTIPRIGAIWAGQGGTNAGLVRGEDGPDYWLVRLDPIALQNLPRVVFGNYGGRVEGADHENDGLANTLALMNSGIVHPAVEQCRSIVHEGHSDIYLAARGEASLCYFNAREGYPEEALHTSTQCRGYDGCAWVQFFDSDGDQWGYYKVDERRVCPVRRLLVI